MTAINTITVNNSKNIANAAWSDRLPLTASQVVAIAYIASVPFEAVQILGGQVLGGKSVPSILGGLLILAVMIDITSGRRTSRVAPAFLVLAYAFVLWATLSYFWSADQASSAVRIPTMIMRVVLTVALASMLPRIARYAMFAFVASSSVLAVSILAQPASLYDSRRTAFGNENDVATLLVVAFVFALVGVSRTSGRYRWALLLSIPLFLAGTIATGSRSAVVALAATVAAYSIWAVRRYRVKGLALAIVTVPALAAVVSAIPEQYIPARLLETSDLVAEGEFTSREIFWAAVLDNGISLSGVGAGGSRAFMTEAVGTEAVTHNLWLGVMLEYGVVGLCLFVAMIIVVLKESRKSIFSHMLPLAIISIGVMSLTLSLETGRVMWFVLALGLAVRESPPSKERSSVQ